MKWRDLLIVNMRILTRKYCSPAIVCYCNMLKKLLLVPGTKKAGADICDNSASRLSL